MARKMWFHIVFLKCGALVLQPKVGKKNRKKHTQTHTHIYILFIYIYIYALLLSSKMACRKIPCDLVRWFFLRTEASWSFSYGDFPIFPMFLPLKLLFFMGFSPCLTPGDQGSVPHFQGAGGHQCGAKGGWWMGTRWDFYEAGDNWG